MYFSVMKYHDYMAIHFDDIQFSSKALLALSQSKAFYSNISIAIQIWNIFGYIYQSFRDYFECYRVQTF